MKYEQLEEVVTEYFSDTKARTKEETAEDLHAIIDHIKLLLSSMDL